MKLNEDPCIGSLTFPLKASETTLIEKSGTTIAQVAWMNHNQQRFYKNTYYFLHFLLPAPA